MGECFICLQSDPPPIRSSCACRGDSGFAHVACLVESAIAQREQRGWRSWTTCQTCLHEFTGEMSLALAEAWSENEPSDTNAQSYLGAALRRSGRYTDCVRIHRGVVAYCRAEHGDDHPDTLCCMGNLAAALGDLGKHEEAESIQRAIISAHRLNTHEELATQTNLASSMRDLGRFEEAESILRSVIGERELAHGKDHALTLHAKCNLGVALASQEKIEEACAIFGDVVARRRLTLGDEHSDTLIAIENVATLCLVPQGRIEEAARMQHDVLSAQRRTLGQEHPRTLTTAYNFANSLWRQEKYEQAIGLVGDVLAARVRALGHSHPDTVGTARCLRQMRTNQSDLCSAANCTRSRTGSGRCVRCGDILYCSRTCRLADAKTHKRTCNE